MNSASHTLTSNTLTPPSVSALPFGLKAWQAVALGLLLPILLYIILPMVGIKSFSTLLDYKKLILLCLGVIGGVGYVTYLRFVLPRPQILLAFLLVVWPLVDYISNVLLEMGLNLHLRPIIILMLAVPGIVVSFKHRQALFNSIPWFKYYLIFFGWLFLYFIFFNANAHDHRATNTELLFEGSMSFIQVTSYFYCLLSVTIPALVMLKIKSYHRLFDNFNIALIGFCSFESLLTIGGYPFGLYNMELDGFTRALGIFTHPNPFAHHMGMLMVYLFGLFCYYQGDRKWRMSMWILGPGIAINFIAFLLGLSKGAISALILSSILLFLLNLAVPAIRRRVPALILSVVLLLPIGVFGFQALSGKSFVDLVASRVEQTESLNWRAQIWQELITDFEGLPLITGRGFTAANARVFQLSFNDAQNAHPLMMVHNAYIALLYDFGVMGYLMFGAVLSMVLYSIRGWLDRSRPELRTGHSILIAMSLYFLFACACDEMSYMFDAPMLYWGLASLIAGMQWRDYQHTQSQLLNKRPIAKNLDQPIR
jgi:O-antigen ligase